jgi:hypothetical protein
MRSSFVPHEYFPMIVSSSVELGVELLPTYLICGQMVNRVRFTRFIHFSLPDTVSVPQRLMIRVLAGLHDCQYLPQISL